MTEHREYWIIAILLTAAIIAGGLWVWAGMLMIVAQR